MMATSKQKRVKLKNLAAESKTNVYEMIRLADELLRDPKFVAEYNGESGLIESLEADEFSHFGGSPSLGELLRAYRHSPDKETWAEYKFNVWAMIELALPAREAEPTERVNWKALAKELEATVARLQADLDQTLAENKELAHRMNEMIEQNGELRGEIRQLEKTAAR